MNDYTIRTCYTIWKKINEIYSITGGYLAFSHCFTVSKVKKYWSRSQWCKLWNSVTFRLSSINICHVSFPNNREVYHESDSINSTHLSNSSSIDLLDVIPKTYVERFKFDITAITNFKYGKLRDFHKLKRLDVVGNSKSLYLLNALSDYMVSNPTLEELGINITTSNSDPDVIDYIKNLKNMHPPLLSKLRKLKLKDRACCSLILISVCSSALLN